MRGDAAEGAGGVVRTACAVSAHVVSPDPLRAAEAFGSPTTLSLRGEWTR